MLLTFDKIMYTSDEENRFKAIISQYCLLMYLFNTKYILLRMA